MNPTILEVKNLSKVYPNGTRGLNRISFSVARGEFLIVIGLSGSGKSTLLRCLNRLQDPTEGEIWFEGEDIAPIKDHNKIRTIRKKIAMIFQHFNLIPRYSVLTNVLAGTLYEMPTWRALLGLFPQELKKEAEEYLRLVGIDSKAKVRADQLSGGQQQRVAIARALMQKPVILLADEPVASLDPATCHIVMDYLKKINQDLGVTIIANLHFLSLVREYGTRVIALKSGEKVFEGPPSEIDEKWFETIYGVGAREVKVQ